MCVFTYRGREDSSQASLGMAFLWCDYVRTKWWERGEGGREGGGGGGGREGGKEGRREGGRKWRGRSRKEEGGGEKERGGGRRGGSLTMYWGTRNQ